MMRVRAVRTMTGMVSSPSTTVDTPTEDQLVIYKRDVLSALADADEIRIISLLISSLESTKQFHSKEKDMELFIKFMTVGVWRSE